MSLELGLFILVCALLLIMPAVWVFEKVINSDGELSIKWRAQGRTNGKATRRGP